ncbi:hypothetical protein FQZ97_1017920 [compost metagenome]
MVSFPLTKVVVPLLRMTVSAWEVPFPLPLPRAAAALTYMPKPASLPRVMPISPLWEALFSRKAWLSCALRRMRFSAAAKVVLAPSTVLPMMVRSPSRATMRVSPLPPLIVLPRATVSS